MAKLYINEKNKKGRINAEIYGHFQNIWEDVSMKVSTWGKILIFLM